jgi:hypothetical protein
MDFDVDDIPVDFIPGVYKISQIADRVKCEVEKRGDP